MPRPPVRAAGDAVHATAERAGGPTEAHRDPLSPLTGTKALGPTTLEHCSHAKESFR